MQAPKKVKYRKQQKMVRHLHGVETRGCDLHHGEYGLRALEAGWITGRQIEASRIAIARTMKRGGKIWVNMFPQKPITKKPAETRMGSGKGSVEYWVAEIRAGRMMFEITGTDAASALKSLRLAAAKLPLKTKIVKRSDFLV